MRVFRNHPGQIAELFQDALAGPFRGTFTHVVFAVLDSSGERRTLGTFEQVFGRAVRWTSASGCRSLASPA
jgi:hypothetical protein